MRKVLTPVRGLLRHRGWRTAWLLLCGTGALLPLAPMMDQPGYELALGLSILHGLAGGPLGIAAVRVLRERGPSRPAGAVLAATALAWLALLPPFLLATAVTLATTPCSPWATAAFFPVLTLPSALAAVSLGGLLGQRLAATWAQGLAWLGVVLVSAAHTAWPLVFGPQVFAYNHLGGYLPGPLYDEALHLPPALLFFRLATLALAVHALAHLARPSTAARVALFTSALTFLGLEAFAPELGFRMDDATLARSLGGLRETEEIVLHYQRGTDEAQVRQMLGDARFRFRQIARFLGEAPPGPVTVWWYPSPQAKRRLVGAAHTQFSKPWRREVHVHAQGFPHPVLKHELVHAMAAPWGAPPFGVTATLLGLSPHLGIIEGLAVAADDPRDELTLTQWAAAMRRRGLLPEVRTLLTPAGFYAAPPARAYTAAGSFLRFLAETRGPAGLRRLYRDGDFHAAYGESLESLSAAYERFLEAVPVDEVAERRAQARFRSASIFERPCAREVAGLVESAPHLAPAEALVALRRCRALQPSEPAHALAEARRLRELQRLGEASALLDAQLERLASEPTLWADTALARAELALLAGELPLARSLLERLLEQAPSEAAERTARVRLAGLDGTPLQRSALLLAFDAPVDQRLAALRAASGERGWAVPYLLGRVLHAQHASYEAARWLARAAEEPGCPPLVAREARRSALEAALGAGDCPLVRRLTPGEAPEAEWIDRCELTSPGPP